MNRTMNKKNIIALLITGFMLFACMFGFTADVHAEGNVDQRLLGTTDGKTYVNEYFNIRIPLFKNMTIADDANLALQNEADANGYTAEKRLADINAGIPTYVQYFSTDNNDIYVLVGKFQSKEEKDYFKKNYLNEDLSETVESWKNDPNASDFKSGFKKVECLGKTRPIVLVKGKYYGKDYTEAHLLYISGDYYAIYAVSGYGTNQLELFQKATRVRKQK